MKDIREKEDELKKSLTKNVLECLGKEIDKGVGLPMPNITKATLVGLANATILYFQFLEKKGLITSEKEMIDNYYLSMVSGFRKREKEGNK